MSCLLNFASVSILINTSVACLQANIVNKNAADIGASLIAYNVQRLSEVAVFWVTSA
jgi:hypothetical protein